MQPGIILDLNEATMVSRIHISTLLFFAAVIWGGLLILDGVSVSVSWFKPFSTVTGLIVLLLTVFDRWAWRSSFLHPWFVSTPNIQGTWKGYITSSWKDPNTRERIQPIEAYLVILQTLSSIQIRLITRESCSDLIVGNIFQEISGIYSVAGIYRNIPNILNRNINPIHQGSILLHVQSDDHIILDGEYWTDRSTKGVLRFVDRSEKIVNDFSQASSVSFRRQE
jgi:hypothetical protein